MKKLVLLLTLLLGFSTSFAQSPSAFNYQAVLRDVSGNIRVNANVNLRVDIIKTSATGTSIYAETFATTTNAFGLINLQVGKGTVVSGTFASIDWGAGLYFIKITVDGTEMSTSQMMSVPYALYAAKAGNGFSGAYNDLTGKPNLFSGNYADLTGKPTFATVASTGSYNDLLNKPSETDPVYGVSVAKSIKASDTARWSNKSNFSGDYNDLTGKPNLSNVALTGYYESLITKPVYVSGSNTATGEYSFMSNTFGSNNTAYGQNTLKLNTVGGNNTAIGAGSMISNTTGQFNTGVGSGSLNQNTYASQNTAVGARAMLLNTTGSFNVALGCNALRDNTEGRSNVAVGESSLHTNSTGKNNTAVGYASLVNNTLGNSNVALGIAAMFHNTTKSYQVAVGDSSLYNNSNGATLAIHSTANTAVGSKSLYANTTGYNNSGFGLHSLYANTTGYSNTAVGVRALKSNSTGRWNTAVGDSALLNANTDKNTAVGYKSLNVATGWDNTAVGYASLLKNTDGFDNVAVGVDALKANTSGDANTAIGKNTLTGCATGNNNTAIGARADITGNFSNATAIGYFAIADANNKVVIGNSDVTSIGGKVNWSLTSDARLKENIVYTSKLGLNFINSLQTATYSYRNDKNKIQYNGLIAQDVQKVLNNLGLPFSGLVVEDNSEKYLRLSYAEFVIPLINSVQELNKKNQDLQQKNDALEATINSMKADLEAIKKAIQK